MSKRGKAKEKSQARQAQGPSKDQALAKHAAAQGFPSGPTPTPYTGQKPYQSSGMFPEGQQPLVSNANEPGEVKTGGKKFKEGQQYYSGGEKVNMGRPDQNNPDTDNNPYTNSNIQDFDLAAGGAGASKGTKRLSKQDMKRLHSQGGFSKQEIIDYANSLDPNDGPGASGGKAQKLLARWTEGLKNKPPGEGETPPGANPTPTNPGDGTTPGNPIDEDISVGINPVKPTPYTPPGTGGIGSGNSQQQQVEQTNSFDRNFGDVNNTIGDGNTIIGSNLGNQDFSVNIGMNQNAQNMGGGSGSGGAIPTVDPLANMMGSQAYAALNDNAWAKSQAMMNGTTGAATAIELNKTLNNTDAKVAGYDYASRMNSQNMLMMGRQMTNNTLGDIWSMQAPQWQMPESPSKIEDNVEELTDKANEQIGSVKI